MTFSTAPQKPQSAKADQSKAKNEDAQRRVALEQLKDYADKVRDLNREATKRLDQLNRVVEKAT